MSTSPNGAPQFRVVIGDTTLTGRLFDNATARDFASQLPMTLTFSDLHGVEKGTPLPRKLSVDGMPAGDDPQIGDLGYWAPDGNLVLYYGDVAYWTGIMRIGTSTGTCRPSPLSPATSTRPSSSFSRAAAGAQA